MLSESLHAIQAESSVLKVPGLIAIGLVVGGEDGHDIRVLPQTLGHKSILTEVLGASLCLHLFYIGGPFTSGSFFAEIYGQPAPI